METTTVAMLRHAFFDGIEVRARQFSDRQMLVEIWHPQSRRRGHLLLSPKTRDGFWIAAEGSETARAVRYYSFAGSPFLEALIESHHLRSATLSALLLFEESFEKPVESPQSMGTRQGCVGNPNGCTGWFQTCNGVDIRPACNDHDTCYQCGAINDGTTREECDEQFRRDILDAGAGAFCANVYYWGVRAMGWLFYQDPAARPPLGPDVYYIGVEINACPDGYRHLCTTYVF